MFDSFIPTTAHPQLGRDLAVAPGIVSQLGA
jgi:hypothetical protein